MGALSDGLAWLFAGLVCAIVASGLLVGGVDLYRSVAGGAGMGGAMLLVFGAADLLDTFSRK